MNRMKRSRIAGVVVLSVLAGSGWLLVQAYPSELGFPFSACIHFAVIGLLGLFVALRRGSHRWPVRSIVEMALAGACVFVLPGAVLELTAGGISSFTSVALFCAIPVTTVFFTDAFGRAAEARNLLWPALVALLGALLLFPVEIPSTTRRIVCFVGVTGCCVLVGAAGIWMHRLLQGHGVAEAVVIVGTVGAAALAAYGFRLGWPAISLAMLAEELGLGAVYDLPLVWLTVWLAREVAPVRLSARFLIAPLATAAESYAIERGPLDALRLLALALIAAGAAMLLVRDEAEEIPGLRLR